MRFELSAETDQWYTPPIVLDRLGRIALDPCYSPLSLVKADFVAMERGLDFDWTEVAKGGLIYVNPPYSDLRKWLHKCREESQRGGLVVALVPHRSETRGFHEDVYSQGARVLCIRSRLKFVSPDPKKKKNGATFPSVLIHWQPPGIVRDALEACFADLGIWIEAVKR